MGSTPRAHLAYGYELGSSEDFKAAERGEYGQPKLPWLTDDDEGEHDDFGTAAEKVLLASVGFTEEWSPDAGYRSRRIDANKRIAVEIEYSGADGGSGWVLVAKWSTSSVEWSDAMTLDLDELNNRPAHEGWDAKLTDALTALGITPRQTAARWLVYPTYG